MFPYRAVSRFVHVTVHYMPWITGTFALQFIACFIIGSIYAADNKVPLWPAVFFGMWWTTTLASGVWIFILSVVTYDSRDKISTYLQIWAESKERAAKLRLQAPKNTDPHLAAAEKEVAEILSPEVHRR